MVKKFFLVTTRLESSQDFDYFYYNNIKFLLVANIFFTMIVMLQNKYHIIEVLYLSFPKLKNIELIN